MTLPSAAGPSLLVLNCGSRTLKAALFEGTGSPAPSLLLSALVDASTENSAAQLTVKDAVGAPLLDSKIPAGKSADAGAQALLDWFGANGYAPGLRAVGHRLVQGGPRYMRSQKITPELLTELRSLVSLDPDHAPAALSTIECVANRFPGLPQVACFDTAFHTSLPEVARIYAIPRRLFDQGVMRYGFHGLACESVLDQLRAEEPALARGRVLLAHLGSGASITAVRDGKSVDTSMGFTPLEGLVMSTRSGDVDPGVLLYLLGQGKISPQQLSQLLNRESGLLGLSESTADMRELLQKEAADPRAALAIQLFCYRAKKYIGAYAAALGGLDLLAFSGGIGENAPGIRERICAGLDFLGLDLDSSSNHANSPLISTAASRVKIRVVRADEELTIARQVSNLLKSESS
jgi:acetate kinase